MGTERFGEASEGNTRITVELGARLIALTMSGSRRSLRP